MTHQMYNTRVINKTLSWILCLIKWLHNNFYFITNVVANHTQLAVYLYFLHIYHKRDIVFVPSLHSHNPLKLPSVFFLLFLKNIACPTPKTWFATNRTEVTCTKDTECAEDEKCCHWFSTKHCLKVISKVPKHGVYTIVWTMLLELMGQHIKVCFGSLPSWFLVQRYNK